MTKAELVEKVANKIKLTKKETEGIVSIIFQSITDSLTEGDKVVVPEKFDRAHI